LEQEKSRDAGRDLDADIEETFFGAVGRNEPRHFSTEIECAYVILDKIHKEGWFYRIDSMPNGVIVTVQCLTGTGKRDNPDRKTFQIGAPTLPLGICLAALKTRG
jgi:hypothetical protein